MIVGAVTDVRDSSGRSAFTCCPSLSVAMNVRLHTFCVIIGGFVNESTITRLAICFYSDFLHLVPNEAAPSRLQCSRQGQMTTPVASIDSQSLSNHIHQSKTQLFIFSSWLPSSLPAILSNASSSTRIPTHSSICWAPMAL